MATQNQKQPKRKQVESTFADKWSPGEVGEELSGTYLGSDEARGTRGEFFRVYHILDGDGKRWSVAGAHLDSIIPQIPRGTYIWVKYDGKVRLKAGTEMNLFKVEVEEGVELREPLSDGAAREPAGK